MKKVIGTNYLQNLYYHLKSRPQWDNILEERKKTSIKNIDGGFVIIGDKKALLKICRGVFFEVEKHEYLTNLQNVALASDAFFPFRDNIDHCSKRGVSCIVQPGGSVADPKIIEAGNEYNIIMCLSGVRVFTH